MEQQGPKSIIDRYCLLLFFDAMALAAGMGLLEDGDWLIWGEFLFHVVLAQVAFDVGLPKEPRASYYCSFSFAGWQSTQCEDRLLTR